MFLRVAMACRSISAIACAPSSIARRCRSARAILAGEGSADFLSAMFSSQSALKQSPLNLGIERAARPFQYIRETARVGQTSDRFSALTLPRILSALISGNLLALGKAGKPRPLHGADMHEHIG